MQAAPPSPSIVPNGTVLDEKFRILRCVGRGGMGAVYEIQHEITKHKRALKLLYPHVVRDRDAVDRFLLEASAAGTIDNPHIVETYDAGWLTSGEPYLVMELLEGESLDERLENGTRIPLDEALHIVAQAAQGVHAAHEAGIVHRDLKPENLFIVVDSELRVFTKVLDFGVSKFDGGLAKSRATRSGAFMGTPQYMSPEQFLDGKRVDRRADVYSLGVILFECVTGAHPYPCDTLAQLARMIMVQEVPPPSSLRPELPPGLDAILARALQKQPDERYASADELARDLDLLRTGEKVTLPHGSRWPSELPPPLRSAPNIPEAKAATVKMARLADGAPPDAVPLARADGITPTLASEAPATMVSRGANPSNKRLALVLFGALAIGLVSWLVWTTPNVVTPVAPSLPSQTAMAEGLASAPSLAAPKALASTIPSTSSSTTTPAAPPPPTLRPAPSAPVAPKPKDYADMNEFPSPH